MIQSGSGIIKRAVVASDFHLPYQDDIALYLLESFLYDFQPDVFVINGDFLDCFILSKYSKVPSKSLWFEDEIELGKSVLSEFRKTIPNAEIKYIEGNHSFRLKSYLINKAPELFYSLSIPDKLKLRELNIEWVSTKEDAARWTDTYTEINGLYIGHFDKINAHSAYTAKALVEKNGVSLIQAHTHRLGSHYKRLLDGKILTGVEGGCMCKLNPSYGGHANWNNGFCVIYWTETNYHIYPILIQDHQFVFNNKVYKV